MSLTSRTYLRQDLRTYLTETKSCSQHMCQDMYTLTGFSLLTFLNPPGMSTHPQIVGYSTYQNRTDVLDPDQHLNLNLACESWCIGISFSALEEVCHVRWSKNSPDKNILNNLHPTSSLVLWHGVDRLFAFFYDCALWLSAAMHASAPAPTDSKLEETESGMLLQYLILCPLRLILHF
jgi:hypothetical protein